jgi:ABC-type bacteriocin/lantibiotic exporter with double-glycine peptidase domain
VLDPSNNGVCVDELLDVGIRGFRVLVSLLVLYRYEWVLCFVFGVSVLATLVIVLWSCAVFHAVITFLHPRIIPV